MNVLVACEMSGVVRDAFAARGHNAWSCDLMRSEKPGNHLQGDVIRYLQNPSRRPGGIFEVYFQNGKDGFLPDKWDLILAFPPCTDLAVSGARWFKEKQADGRQQAAIDFFMFFTSLECPRVVIENPVGIMSTRYRKPDQTIQPWQFGHGETKATCLWLKGLPKLQPTNIVSGREARIHKMPPGPNRGIERSKTYHGIAQAFAEQWG